MERGLVKDRMPCEATVLCERVPFWLGGMRRVDWSAIRMNAWVPRDEWDHPEIAAAMRNLVAVIEEKAGFEVLMREAGTSGIVLSSGSLDFIGKILPCLTSRGNAPPCLIFVESVRRREVLPKSEGLF